MLVYGDHAWEEQPRDKLARIERCLESAWAMPDGIGRHGALVAAFVELGELTQGLADRDFAERQADARSASGDGAMRLLIALAHAVESSWESGFCERGPSPLGMLRHLRELELPETISVSLPEGYAFYALYPEAYIKAAKPLAGRSVKVMGLRSIGTGLAAAVAAGSGRRDAVTLRPIGDPFRRTLALSDGLREKLLLGRGMCFAIADEGPGLSGSSFGCVADFLEENGVDRRRIHFFPSHPGGLGPEALPHHRERWAAAQRHVIDFEDLVVKPDHPAHRLESWVADIAGKPAAPLIDISGGVWRQHRYASEAQWPPANPQQERRKFILRSEGGSWLLKFAGLGRYGSEKLKIARALAEGGFAPPAAGVRHGFLVVQWLEDARPLSLQNIDTGRLVDHLGRYLGFRARCLPAPQPGASLDELWIMASRNTGLALGADLARTLDRWKAGLPGLSRHVIPIRTDNRLHAWEWLILGDRLLKTDALDHHAAHDLVGCQDLAWDIAGATVEFGLGPDQRDRLCAVAEREAGRPLVPELVEFLTICYLAFQLGSYKLAAASATQDRKEALRLHAAVRCYREALRQRLSGEPARKRASAVPKPSY